MPTSVGVNLGLKPFGKKNKANKIAEKKSPSNFAEKFAGNFPKIHLAKVNKFTPTPLCTTSGST